MALFFWLRGVSVKRSTAIRKRGCGGPLSFWDGIAYVGKRTVLGVCPGGREGGCGVGPGMLCVIIVTVC